MQLEMVYGIVPLRHSSRGEWEVLLLRHSRGDYWGFPKGHPLFPEETPRQVAARELEEELQLTVSKFLEIEPLCEEHRFLRGDKQICKSVELFPALVEGRPVADGTEILEARWFPLEAAVRQLTFAGTRSLLLTLISQLS